jgi:hypothetical protein
MKKIILIMSLFLLVGCAQGTSIEDPAVLYEYKGKTITQEDVFLGLMKVDQGNVIIQEIETKVIEELTQENKYDLNEAIKKELETFEKYAQSLGIDMEQFVVYYGFSDLERFNHYVSNRVFMEYYAKDKLESDLAGYVKQYDVRNFVVFTAEDVEQAKKIKQMAMTATIDEIKDTYKKATAEAMVYTNEYPDLDENTHKALKSETVYHVESSRNVFVYNEKALTDEELVDGILKNTNVSTDVFIKAIADRNFKVHHKILKDLMKDSYSEYMK